MKKTNERKQLKLLIIFCIITISLFITRTHFININMPSNIAIYVIIILGLIVIDFIVLIMLLYYFIRYDIKLAYKSIKCFKFKNILSCIKNMKKGTIISICIIFIILLSTGGYYHTKAKKVNLSTKTVMFKIPFNKLTEDEKDKYLSLQANTYIYDKLKAPSTAVFSDPNKLHQENVIPGNQSNSYIVIGYVDAQNSFGAMVRNNFSVTIQVNDNKYDKELNGYNCNVLSYTSGDEIDQ
ncbi:MAG: hypothetical protein LKF87_00565 [Clostridium tyrobutyricum]|uniref:hypothetical protein n=1 Tax=Clostridium tyrobutyricum TaxID=1519 RepID=UPI00073D99A1|nr:hypothetical protein [Clostridium tyrobutyricum]MCH4198706.1 hypothetical protein [Clostridium tyrobutyricum]MCH4257443.1 hypothetical protein [Clostridium tyrobutyricum]MCI1238287.1 hypothetical protein [Clostridium tyrobutyricum]MCI1652000.1 hypothetical protein [Clostridium tyrobutyricum]MCI1936797.1 hypothetical protein [Clostridium tyrobutyricum]